MKISGWIDIKIQVNIAGFGEKQEPGNTVSAEIKGSGVFT
jgi:hypothetical protein